MTHSPPPLMRAAIQTSLFAENFIVNDMQPVCSSGNCTSPSYRSLAICAQSADITSYLRTKNVSVPGDFPGAPEYNRTQWYISKLNYLIYDHLSLSSVAKKHLSYRNQQYAVSLDFNNSIAFKNSPSPIADIFMIYANASDSSIGTFSATEFVLEWCVQNFTTSVTNGLSSTEKHGSVSNLSKPDSIGTTAHLTAKPDDGDNRVYKIELVAHSILQK